MADKPRRVVRERVSTWTNKLLNRYLVLRTFGAVTLFVLAFTFFSFLLRRANDLGRGLIVIYGVFVIVLCLILIGEYVIKTIALQRAERVVNYSAVVAINTLFGLITPLFFTNVILAVIIRAMAAMKNYGTLFCDIRCSSVNFYYNTGVYQQLNSVIFWLLIMTAVLWIFGGLFERLRK